MTTGLHGQANFKCIVLASFCSCLSCCCRLWFVFLSVCLLMLSVLVLVSVCLSVCLSVCPCISLSVCLWCRREQGRVWSLSWQPKPPVQALLVQRVRWEAWAWQAAYVWRVWRRVPYLLSTAAAHGNTRRRRMVSHTDTCTSHTLSSQLVCTWRPSDMTTGLQGQANFNVGHS